MSRVLRIELRRSVAIGAALVLVLAGAVLLYSAPQRWSAGWMQLAMTQREYLVLLWPLALAAGAWQSRREHRSNVAELFASTARPRVQRVVPILGALAIAVSCAYLLVVAAATPWIVDTYRYLPAATFAVAAVGVLAMISAAWLGLGIGRLVPSLITAPALAVAGMGLLLGVPAGFRSREWLAMLFSPMHGMGQYTDYQTVAGRVSAAQGIWLAALGGTGVVLLAAGSWRTRLAALLPAALGAAVGIVVIPTGAAFAENPIDPVAQQQVCADGTPRVCVSRVHRALLAEATPIARQGLTLLAKLPNAPTTAQEDTTTFFGDPPPVPAPDVVVMDIQVDSHGHLARSGAILPRMLYAAGVSPARCPDGPDSEDSRAVAYWLLGREPQPDPQVDESPDINAEAVAVWQSLRRLPEAEATARVAAFRSAALACQDATGVLSRSPR